MIEEGSPGLIGTNPGNSKAKELSPAKLSQRKGNFTKTGVALRKWQLRKPAPLGLDTRKHRPRGAPGLGIKRTNRLGKLE